MSTVGMIAEYLLHGRLPPARGDTLTACGELDCPGELTDHLVAQGPIEVTLVSSCTVCGHGTGQHRGVPAPPTTCRWEPPWLHRAA